MVLVVVTTPVCYGHYLNADWATSLRFRETASRKDVQMVKTNAIVTCDTRQDQVTVHRLSTSLPRSVSFYDP